VRTGTRHLAEGGERRGDRAADSRVSSGPAPRGFDAGDDGHLEVPWTGDVITTESANFLVTVRTSR
jgi:hypothetical protein